MDPLVAKNLKQEGFNTKEDLSKYLTEEVKGGRSMMPRHFNFLVVGGEWNQMWLTTDFFFNQTVSVDKWIPKSGIRKDANPLRMPVASTCKDGVCGLPGPSA